LIRRFGSLCLLFTLPAALAVAQSMGDVAKKERERREKLRQTGGGSVTSVDADQLAANKGTLANDTKQPAASAAGGKSQLNQDDKPAQVAARDDEMYWRSRVAAYRGRLEEAQRRYDALDRMIRFGQRGQRDENGVRRIYSAQDMKLMADSAQADLAKAKAALEALADEGRRAGALPGWFR
jgi:hypothetical protein